MHNAINVTADAITFVHSAEIKPVAIFSITPKIKPPTKAPGTLINPPMTAADIPFVKSVDIEVVAKNVEDVSKIPPMPPMTPASPHVRIN